MSAFKMKKMRPMSSKNAPKRRENAQDAMYDLEQQFILRLPPVHGVKGASPLVILKYVDLPKIFVIDWMHCVLLGVTKALMKLWLDNANKTSTYYVGDKIVLLNRRLMKIQIPDFVARKPRSLVDHSHWKATEYREWLLHFSIPVLRGVLKPTALVHYSLLVSAMNLLNKEHILFTEITYARKLIMDFSRYYSHLYGNFSQTMNIHQLKHIPDFVKLYGPLFTMSCFGFESMNAHLKNMVHGTRFVNNQGPAMALHHDIQTGSLTLKDKLSIEMQPDMRHARVRYGGDIFTSKVVDMPCIVESLKTVDKKTFYKTADINKVVICTTEDDFSQDESDSPKKKDKDKKYIYSHGITPPLKNVKKRRFRKTLKKKFMDQPEIEKEVKRLFRYDAEAIDVKWEIIRDESETNSSGQIMEGSTSSRKTPGGLIRNDTEASMDVASYFGEVSSSDEDKDINIMDSGEEEASRGPSTPRISFGSLDRSVSESQDTIDPDTDFQMKLAELSNQLSEIREKKREQKRRESMDEGIDKEEYEFLCQAESEKEKEYEILSSMFNQS